MSRTEMHHQAGLKASSVDDSASKEDSKLSEEIREEKRSYRHKFEQMQKCRESLTQSRSDLEVIKLEVVTGYFGSGGGRSQETAKSRFSSAISRGMSHLLYFITVKIYVSSLGTKLCYLADTGSESRASGRSETFENKWEGEYCNMEEERMTTRHPDGLAFYQAQKANASQLAQNSQHIKQMLKNKRL